MEAALRAYQETAQRKQRDELIVSHLGYVRHILGRLLAELPDGVDAENLESAGVLGLVEAASQFDPNRGVAFATFAYRRIRGAILDELRRNCPLPQDILERWSKIRDAISKIETPATTEQLAAATGFTIDQIEECLEAARLTRIEPLNDDPLERPPGTSDGLSPQAQVLKDEQLRLLADAIEELPERLRLVVTLYYLEGLRLKEIGEVLELSESRVSRLLARAQFELGQLVRASLE